jgi:hypothetical protein
MTRDQFKNFVADALEDVIGLAEARTGKPLPRTIAFQWIGAKNAQIYAGIVDAIVDRVFVSEGAIYPCVDMGVGDLLDDGTPLIVASIAGFPPRPFGDNWTGRPGPFVRIIGARFVAKISGKSVPKSGERDMTPFAYFIPDMEDLT